MENETTVRTDTTDRTDDPADDSADERPVDERPADERPVDEYRPGDGDHADDRWIDEEWDDSDLARPDEVPADPPRRFLLRRYDEDGVPSLFLWGVQVGGGAIAFDRAGAPLLRSGSAHRALRLFGTVHDLDLLWLDPPAP